MSAEWREEQTRADAELIAHERIARFDRERAERLAQYALVWERRFTQQRLAAAVAGGVIPSLWRVIK